MIAFFNHEDPVACFGQVFGTYTSTTARAHDDYICLDGLNIITCFKLKEFEVKALN